VCAASVIATDESIARQLLDRDRVRERVGARAAVLLGDRHAHQPELGQLRDELVREAVLAVELGGDRRDLLLANSRTVERTSSCSGVRSKFTYAKG
jgi:hypothetical protein